MKIETTTLNNLLGYIVESDNIDYNPLRMNKDIIELLKTKSKELSESNISELEGYSIGIEQAEKGGHKDDGQWVRYEVTFVSPTGDKTILSSDMSLKDGWNFKKSQEIK